MIKKFFVCAVCLFIVTISYAQSDVFIKFFSKRMDISVNESDVKKYVETDEIPELLYGSKIVSYGMTIVSVYNIDFKLKNGQGILFSRDPITDEIIVYKTETSMDDKIKVDLNKSIEIEMNTEDVFAFSKTNDNVKLRLINGNLEIKEKGIVTNVFSGDSYYFKN